MDEFETLLEKEQLSAERFVRFRIHAKADADDVLQEVFLSAYQHFPNLKNKDAFKGWLLRIARNKCNDYFRKKANPYEIPMDLLTVKEVTHNKHGASAVNTVRETLQLLGDKDKEILYLTFFEEMPQAEIAKRLNLPVGTVKSRLHTAKRNFRNQYPYPPNTWKGESSMKKFPEIIPNYTITPLDTPPFPVVFEELPNWFIVPRPGEEVTWASYASPAGKITEKVHSKVTSSIFIHTVEGAEITTEFESCDNELSAPPPHTYYAQVTDSHCRWLGESYIDRNGSKRLLTFLDGDDFLSEWGYGEDNCGTETHLRFKGKILRNADCISVPSGRTTMDVTGHCLVSINGKEYDTVCVTEWVESGSLTESFVDKNGKTVLWRRFNRDDRTINQSETLTVNGDLFVHRYDCITDYVL